VPTVSTRDGDGDGDGDGAWDGISVNKIAVGTRCLSKRRMSFDLPVGKIFARKLYLMS
jgi:hypothetical protein